MSGVLTNQRSARKDGSPTESIVMNLHHIKKRVYTFVRHTWLGRVVAGVGTVVLLLLAVFFFTIFLTVFAILVIVIIARILWAQHRINQKTSENVIDVEYSVEETKVQQPGEAAPSEAQCLDYRRSQKKR